MIKKTIIIGAAGFVGDYLAERLLFEGYEVYATKLATEVYSRENVTVLNLDILNVNNITEILSDIRPDIIFHLAAQSSVFLSWENPQLTVDINIKGTVNMLEVIRRLGLSSRIILIGSGEEYGFSFSEYCPVSEDIFPKPANIYAVTKVAQNMLGELYAKSYSMDIVTVRAFNHIGPRQSDQFVVSDLCKQVAEMENGLREPCILVGNISVKRDFTDVRDIVAAYGVIAKHGIMSETYNVGSGKSVSIQDILYFILSQSNVDVQVIEDKNKFRPSDMPVIQADIQKIRSIGWEPLIDLQKSLMDVLEYWRKIISEKQR